MPGYLDEYRAAYADDQDNVRPPLPGPDPVVRRVAQVIDAFAHQPMLPGSRGQQIASQLAGERLLRSPAKTRVTGPRLPEYVYVASSWRNPLQPAVCAVLAAAGIEHYDFRNPEGGTGFSWSEVKSPGASSSTGTCEHCLRDIVRSSFTGLGYFEPDVDPANDPVVWRHRHNGYATCGDLIGQAIPKKGSDWEPKEEYLRMVNHPRAIEGFEADFGAMQKADTFVMVLPCGKSAHLELGWAIGAGKRTAILLENPVEPELMYRMADHLATSVHDLLGWMGVQD